MQTSYQRKRCGLRPLGLCAIWLGLVVTAPAAADELAEVWSDDAELTCIAMLDENRGWICGDRGVILQTEDGGAHWERRPSGVACRLRSIHFVDERHGWAVGGTYDPYVHRSRGVVLATDDGGRSWRREAAGMVPLLRRIHMFNTREGYAVGDAADLAPAGLLFTRDGGKTWSGAGGDVGVGLLAADLSSPASGVCADGAGRVLRLHERLVQASPELEFGLRSVRRIVLGGALSLLVGDGGLVFASRDAGRSWSHPGQNLAEGAGRQCDWRGVALQGTRCWIVGNPGSVVLHSADAGATWELLPTGRTSPLNDVAFVDERRGVAVGALGAILTTDDGGRTWTKRSAGERRPALWACFADVESVPYELIAQACAEDGYRTVAALLGRRDAEPGVDDGRYDDDRRAAALAALGISAVEQAWSFPLRQNPLQPTGEVVLQAWGEGDAGDGLFSAESYLVRELRTWRPEVVLTHAPAPRGEAPTSHLLHQLVLRAVEAAADPRKFPEQIEQLGLSTWQARKAFGYDPRQNVGTVAVPTSQVISCAAESIDDFCEPARALIFDGRRPAPAHVAARLYFNRTASTTAERELFAGLTVPAGGEARRAARSDDPANRVRMSRAAERQRNLEAVVLQRSGEVGDGLAEQIRALTAGQKSPQAGDTVFQLAETFRRKGRWEAARETYEYLLTHHNQHPACDAALRRLIEYLASGEADHRLERTLADLRPTSPPSAPAPTGELSKLPAEGLKPPSDTPPAAAAPPAAVAPAPQSVALGAENTTLHQQLNGQAAPQTASFERLRITTAPSAPTITQQASLPTPAAVLLGKDSAPVAPAGEPVASPLSPQSEVTRAGMTEPSARARRALGIGAYYAQRDAAAHAVPQVGFPLAAARRKLGQTAEAEAFFDHFVRSQPAGPWLVAAADELALVRSTALTKPAARAPRVAEKPVLDGKLGDSVWHAAAPIELRSALADDESWPATAWLAGDEEHLYLAVRCRRTMPVPPLPAGTRQRDSDLAAHDRVEFCFDVDRDYATYYRFAVDHRGWTTESCWGDTTWDPKWFVAAGGDDGEWIVEAAIPWRELVAERPAPGQTWALGIFRTSPQVGFQSFSRPAAAAATRPEGFGHLTFE